MAAEKTIRHIRQLPRSPFFIDTPPDSASPSQALRRWRGALCLLSRCAAASEHMPPPRAAQMPVFYENLPRAAQRMKRFALREA